MAFYLSSLSPYRGTPVDEGYSSLSGTDMSESSMSSWPSEMVPFDDEQLLTFGMPASQDTSPAFITPGQYSQTSVTGSGHNQSHDFFDDLFAYYPVTLSQQSGPLPPMIPRTMHRQCSMYEASAPRHIHQQAPFDTTSQIAPLAAMPQVLATLWEDEGIICYHVQVNGVSVARREDNHFINGTKLLDVAAMPRDRSGRVLRSEKTTHVVIRGPPQFRGIWIPFDRALELANKEKITEQLYPLFVHDIGASVCNLDISSHTRIEHTPSIDFRSAEGIEPAWFSTPMSPTSHYHHHPMQSSTVSQLSVTSYDVEPYYSIAPHQCQKPSWDYAQFLPTPPHSTASSSVRHRRSRTKEVVGCVPCRARKVRCNRDSPCKQCQDRSPPISCFYTSSGNDLDRDSAYGSKQSSYFDYEEPQIQPGQQNPAQFNVGLDQYTVHADCNTGSNDFSSKKPAEIRQSECQLNRPNPVEGLVRSCATDGTHELLDNHADISTASGERESSCAGPSVQHVAETKASPTSHNFPTLGLGPSVIIDRDTSGCHLVSIRARASPTSQNSNFTSSGFSDDSDFDEGESAKIVKTGAYALLNLFVAALQREMPSAQLAADATGNPSTTSRYSHAPNVTTSTSTSQTSGIKRKEPCKDNDGNDEQDQSQHKRSKDGLFITPHSASKQLACPFHKYDSYLFGPDSPDPAYHVCGACKFVNAAHLKQHLQRNHRAPKLYCPSCYVSEFDSQVALNAHLRARPACEPREPPLYLERINSDLAEVLKLGRRNDHGVDRVDYWFTVFDTLFPGVRDERDINPYYEGPAREHLNAFVAFCNPLVGRVLSTILEQSTAGQLVSDLTSSSIAALQGSILQRALTDFDCHLAELRWPHVAHRQQDSPPRLPRVTGTTVTFNMASQPTTMTPYLTSGSSTQDSPEFARTPITSNILSSQSQSLIHHSMNGEDIGGPEGAGTSGRVLQRDMTDQEFGKLFDDYLDHPDNLHLFDEIEFKNTDLQDAVSLALHQTRQPEDPDAPLSLP